ncbi:MAG: GNAT family N-acetyltransferase [Roseiflexaceae bacterium]
MSEPAHIRLFEPGDQEYAAVAHIAAQSPVEQLADFEYARAANLRDFDASFEGSGHVLRRYVAEASGAIVAYAQLFHMPWLRESGHFWLNLRVAPAHGRRGIGGRLYEHLIADLRELGATAAWIMAHESTPALATGLERRGFHELFRSWPFTLDPRDFDLARFQQAMDRVAAGGITITTLAAEHERDHACLPKLYELHTTITREIPLPGHPHPAPGLAWFERYACSSPLALPEAFFIARDGARYAGESFMQRIEGLPGELSHKVTGVHGDYRGHGIAMALKLATIAYAQQHGYTRIWTAVESNNPSMLAINARLGFVQWPGLIVLEKRIGEGGN